MNTRKTQYLRGKDLAAEPQVIESVSGGVNGGCNLYIGTSTAGSRIKVKNLSGDEINFYNPIQGTIIPFIVTEITGLDNVSNLVALW